MESNEGSFYLGFRSTGCQAVWHNEVNESVQQFEQSSSHRDTIKRHEHALKLATLDRGYQSPAYNHVIAWLRLLRDGSGPFVKGYAYRVSQQRIVRNFKPEDLIGEVRYWRSGSPEMTPQK